MPRYHELAGRALERAIHGMSEPGIQWRGALGSQNWEQARSGGSANIPLMAAAAWLHYSKNGNELTDAKTRLANYYYICKNRWMLAEPESLIYDIWIIMSWAAVIKFSRDRGIDDLRIKYTDLLSEWIERATLMQSTVSNANYVATPRMTAAQLKKVREDRRDALGKAVVCLAGCRSWPGANSWNSARQLLYRAMKHGGVVRNNGRNGVADGYAWTYRAANALVPIFRELYSGIRISNWKNWAPARSSFQYIGWSNGSRLCVMGYDETNDVDDDENSNTPGVLLYGVVDGKPVVYPTWPDPITGKDHIRQKAIFSDIDGPFYDGSTVRFTMHSSEFGWTQTGGEKFTTMEFPDLGVPVFHIACHEDGKWFSVIEMDDDPPPPTPHEEDDDDRNWFQKFLDWIKGIF